MTRMDECHEFSFQKLFYCCLFRDILPLAGDLLSFFEKIRVIRPFVSFVIELFKTVR
jgi:hypothetical protein